jgi:limonene 1,2-monooxygenase
VRRGRTATFVTFLAKNNALQFAAGCGYRVGEQRIKRQNWANPSATVRSYELIAREVMPQFQGHAQATLDAARRAKEVRESLAAAQAQAVEDARARYGAEVAKRQA